MWVRANYNVGVAYSFVEDRTEGVERSANVLIVGGHNLVRFGRKNIGERSSSVGGHAGSCRRTVAFTMQLRRRVPKDNDKSKPTSGQSTSHAQRKAPRKTGGICGPKDNDKTKPTSGQSTSH